MFHGGPIDIYLKTSKINLMQIWTLKFAPHIIETLTFYHNIFADTKFINQTCIRKHTLYANKNFGTRDLQRLFS